MSGRKEKVYERFVVIEHIKSIKVIHARFIFSESRFEEFVKLIDKLHDTRCSLTAIDEDDYEDFPDAFGDEKLELDLNDERLGEPIKRFQSY